jgi:hypothetical protein
VRSNGQIKWAGELVFVGEALIGEAVGVVETEAGDWLVRYADVELGYIHPQRRRLSPRPLHAANRFNSSPLHPFAQVRLVQEPWRCAGLSDLAHLV